jgi:hypothetical protein
MTQAAWYEGQTEVTGFTWRIPDGAMEPEFPQGWYVIATRVDARLLEPGEAILIEQQTRDYELCYFVKRLEDRILGIQKANGHLRHVFYDVSQMVFAL